MPGLGESYQTLTICLGSGSATGPPKKQAGPRYFVPPCPPSHQPWTYLIMLHSPVDLARSSVRKKYETWRTFLAIELTNGKITLSLFGHKILDLTILCYSHCVFFTINNYWPLNAIWLCIICNCSLFLEIKVSITDSACSFYFWFV